MNVRRRHSPLQVWHEVMTPEVFYCFADDDIHEAAELMEEKSIHRLLVLDDTNEPVGFGEWGEPVVTTFSRAAMPLIRFRSNDRVKLLPPDLCDCGRTSRALWEVGSVSRYDDMLKIKATNVWPQTVDEAIFSYDEIDEYNGRVFITDAGLEVARVSIEFKKIPLDDNTKADIIKKLHARIKELTQVTMQVEEVPFGTLQRFEYKARRWTDERIEGLERVKYLEK